MQPNDIVSQSQQLLAQLPQMEPPERIWARVLETRLRQQRKKVRRWQTVSGIAAALILSVITVFVYQSRQHQPVDQLNLLMVEARVYEERLQTFQNASVRLQPTQQYLISERQARLTALDQALAEAYASHAPAEVILELWQSRVELLKSLLSPYQSVEQEVSI